MVPADSERGLPAKPPKFVTLSNPMIKEMESNLMYQARGCESMPSFTHYHKINVQQGIKLC